MNQVLVVVKMVDQVVDQEIMVDHPVQEVRYREVVETHPQQVHHKDKMVLKVQAHTEEAVVEQVLHQVLLLLVEQESQHQLQDHL